MSLFLQILFGLLFVGFGVSCVRWNQSVTNSLREFQFIRTLGGGNEYDGTKFLGILSILFGMTIALGLWQALLGWITGSFVGLIK